MISMSFICGECGESCQSLHSGRGNKMVCEKCAWGTSYDFIKRTQANINLPFWKRRILAFLYPFSGCGCSHCGLNYRFGEHSTTYMGRGSSGCHLLCNWCWRELPLEKKLKYYRKHHEEVKADLLEGKPAVVGHCQYDGWKEKDFNEEWELMKNAVIEEHYLIPFDDAA